MLETVRTSQNRTQTCDLLVRPDFMYQTNMRKSLVSSFGIVSSPLSQARRWDGSVSIPKNIAGIRTINRLSFRSGLNCFGTLEKTLDASGTGTAFWFDQTLCTKLVFEKFGTRLWYRLLVSLHRALSRARRWDGSVWAGKPVTGQT